MTPSTRLLPALVLLILLTAVATGAERVATDAAVAAPVRLPVEVIVPEKGLLSLALYDEAGTLVRSLLYAEPVEKGQQIVQWDGTTDLGLPAAPGTYAARGIFFTEPPSLEYVMTVGKSGNPPYRTPDGKGDWGANLGYPSSIATNGREMIIGFSGVEDSQITGVQQIDTDGNIQMRYFTFYPWDQRMAAAMDDQNYYLGIYSFDRKRTEIGVFKVGEPRGKILVELPVTPIASKSGRWKGRESSFIDGMAVHGDALYASVSHADALFIIDRAKGEIRKRLDIPAPRGLAVAGDRLLVVSGNSVLSFALDGSEQRTLVPEGTLQGAYAMTVDKAGNIYVGDSGATYHLDIESESGTRQVRVFSPDGKPLRTLGKPGGTPRSGQFDPNGFGIITALAIGPDGKLWVADIATGFKRTSRWTTDGTLEREWFNRRLQHVADIINPARPNELISPRTAFDDEPGLYAYEIDLAKRTWRPAWYYEMTTADALKPAEGVFVSHDHGGNPLKTGTPDITWPIFEFTQPSFVHYNGRNYVMSGDGNGEGSIHLYSPDQEPQAVALVSFHRVEQRDGMLHGFYDRGPNNWFTWVDRDGDRRMAMPEITLTEQPALLASVRRVASARLTDTMDIRMKLLAVEEGKTRLVDAVLPLKEILPDGAPVYDWSLLREVTQLQMPDLAGGDGTKRITETWSTVPIETADGFYSIIDPKPAERLRLPGIDGEGWWASRNWRKKLVKWDKDTGEPIWAVGRRAPGRAERGQMYNPIMLAGAAGDALLVADGLSVVWAWHKDGLYLGRLYNDFGAGVADTNSLYIELQGTEVHTDPATGKIYSLANDTAARIHEVKLPATTAVEGSTVTLSPADVEQVQPWDPDGVPPTEKPAAQIHPRVKPVTIDGDLNGREGWDEVAPGKRRLPMLVLLDGQRLASVRAMYDEENLYLGYQVTAPNGPINAGSELPLSPFVSGAYVDVHIGPEWNGPRDEVRAGDVRVILARVRSGDAFEDYQQGFWQVRPGGTSPQTITSPAAQVHFDHIAPVPGLQMAFSEGKLDEKSGLVSYNVEVAIPLASIGLSSPAGKTVGFDLSVGVSNAPGDRRERAGHWAGLSEGVVVDRPGSTRLLPATWGTLMFMSAP